MITIDSELIIQNGKKYYCPAVLEGIEWSTERIGAPGQLTFKILEDKKLKISEGNAVRFKYKGKKVFYLVIEIKSDGDDCEENKAKYKYALEHFDNLNEIINEIGEEEEYIFHFLSYCL